MTVKANKYNVERWCYVVLSVLLMMMYGTVYSWSVFRVPVEAHFEIGATLSGLPYMFFLLTYALSMMFGGLLIERYSPRVVLISGGFFVTLGWILSALSSGIVFLTMTYGILIGFGVGISYGVPIYVMTQWFPKKRGVVIGIILAGFGLSPLITAPFGYWMIASFGLIQTFVNYGIIFGIFIPILSYTIKTPDKAKQFINVSVNSARIIGDQVEQSMLKSKSFKSVYACFFLGTMIGLTIIGLTNNVGKAVVGLEAAVVAKWMIIFALFNGLGRPVFGWITERFRPSFAMRISFILISVASIFMLFAHTGNQFLYILAFSILWLNLGAWLAIAPMTTMALYGMEHYSKNYGIIFTAYGFGAVVGVMSTGLFIDIFNNYKVIFMFIIFLSLIGIIETRQLDKVLKRS